MKRMFGLLFLFLICGVGSILAQSGEVSVQNPQVSGNQVSFDVYLRSTTTTTLYLTESSLYLAFDQSKFSGATASFTSSLPAGYTGMANIYPNKVGLEIGFPAAPSTTNTVAVATGGTGTKLGTVTLTGLTNFTGNLGLLWNTTAPYISSAFYWDPNTNTEFPISLTGIVPQTISLAATFEAIITNQQLLNNQYTYDLYLRRTGGSSFYIDDADIIVTFNSSAFGPGATYSLESAAPGKIADYYTFQNFMISGNELGFSIAGPTVTSQAEFNTRVQQVAGPGDSTFIGRFKVTNALNSTTVTNVNPQWKTTGTLPLTLIYNRQSTAPWNSNDVTANGTYIVRAPIFSVTVTAPNGGEILCPGSSTNITWVSSNITNVAIDLRQSGVTVATITASTSASLGSYTWNIPGNLTAGNNYSIRVRDLSNGSVFDDSNSNFTIGSAPAITGQPVSMTVISGSNATLTVTATGTNLMYQWQVETTPGTFVNVSGATSSSLTFAPAQVANGGNYRVVVSGSCAPAATSSIATLTVLPQGVTVGVKMFLQGYWNGTRHIPAPVSVELRSGANLSSSVLVSRTTGMLSSTGTVTTDFSGVISGNYWIVVRSGGYLAVGSASAVAMTSGTTLNYDFTDAASKAFEDGTIPVVFGGNTYYVLKAGDLNGDISVNPTDLNIFLQGYPKTNALSIPPID
jgi:hypothetical protein